ncbi:MAG: hypothetical protein HYZ50_20335 [Deltaproteobacteria bacterium]|nr:hypothetical protein [Deltaproteobacteria bacterium]
MEPSLQQSGATQLPHSDQIRVPVTVRRYTQEEGGQTHSSLSDYKVDAGHLTYLPSASSDFLNTGSMLAPMDPFLSFEAPPIVTDPSARPLLTDRVQRALQSFFLPFLDHEARRNGIPVSKIEIRGFSDPEEDTQEIVVSQWVKVPADMALDYWDQVGAAFECWLTTQPVAIAQLLQERMALEIRWEETPDV